MEITKDESLKLLGETTELTEEEWNRPFTLRLGEWHTLQNDNASLREQITRLTQDLKEARDRAIDECARLADAHRIENYLEDTPYIKGFHEGQNSTALCIAREISALKEKQT